MNVYSQEEYSLSQVNDLISLLLRLFLPSQEVFIGERTL